MEAAWGVSIRPNATLPPDAMAPYDITTRAAAELEQLDKLPENNIEGRDTLIFVIIVT